MKIKALVDNGNGGVTTRDLVIENVYYVPNFPKTLLSVSTLIPDGHAVEFNRVGCTVFSGNRKGVGCIAREQDGVYQVLTENDAVTTAGTVTFAMALSVLGLDLETWHRRMGHVNYKTLKWMAKHKIIKGLNIKPGAKPPMCVICSLVKATERAPPKEHPRNVAMPLPWGSILFC
jgi:hypothetical protein